MQIKLIHITIKQLDYVLFIYLFILLNLLEDFNLTNKHPASALSALTIFKINLQSLTHITNRLLVPLKVNEITHSLLVLQQEVTPLLSPSIPPLFKCLGNK